jgi:hypothetical protein
MCCKHINKFSNNLFVVTVAQNFEVMSDIRNMLSETMCKAWSMCYVIIF